MSAYEHEGDYEVPMKRSDIAALQERSGRTEDAEARAQAAERRAAFALAGIDVDDPTAQIFVAGYSGELTKAAIQAAAAPFNLVQAPTTTPPPSQEQTTVTTSVSEEDRQRFSEQEALARGPVRDVAPPPPPVDPYEDAIETATKARLAGAQTGKANATFYNAIANAGHAGDERVIIDRRDTRATGGPADYGQAQMTPRDS